MKTLLTGAAGFIGMHTALKLLKRGDEVVGIDNINNYYDPLLKQARLNRLKDFNNFKFIKSDISDDKNITKIFKEDSFQKVIHLAAQAGVRYSIENPQEYINSNLVGFANILENCRTSKIDHLVYASSSSVYGGNELLPFREKHNVDHPISLYAATKKSNELSAHAYSHLYKIPTTGLRFFTVYGPWGRPDMALFLFTKNILENKPINVFNKGQMIRDFTYIDDIVEGVVKTSDKPASPSLDYDPKNPNPSISDAPYKVFNIGNGDPIPLMDYISSIENALGISAQINLMEAQKGDVISTCADNSELEKWIGFKPSTSINNGVKKFTDWYKDFYKI